MTQIISLVNHKGGVGKTTTTLNLGKALSLLGKKVLVIDMDPQANLSQSVGIEDAEHTMYNALSASMPLPVHEVSENFAIVPSELGLSVAETALQAEQVTGYFKLKKALQPLKKQYEYVLIDCPPSLSILTINALLASTDLIIVVEPQYLAIKGLQTIIDLYTRLKEDLHPELNILGLLITQFNRTVVSKSIIEQLQKKYKEVVFQTIIRQSVKITEASALKKDIFLYDKQSTGAEDYLNLAKEILQIA